MGEYPQNTSFSRQMITIVTNQKDRTTVIYEFELVSDSTLTLGPHCTDAPKYFPEPTNVYKMRKIRLTLFPFYSVKERACDPVTG